jgi:hypothetical protein
MARPLNAAAIALLAAGCQPSLDAAPPSAVAPAPPSATSALAPSATPSAVEVGCDARLSPESLDRLQMEGSGRDVAPGDRVELRVGRYTDPGAPMERVNACVTWSVDEPATATIDPGQHSLTVLPGATGVVHVHARVRASGAVVSGELVVIPKELAPLIGVWKEEARLDCTRRTWVTPPKPIRELHVRAERKVLVTWTPFEVYYDYSAAFTWDPGTGKMSLQVEKVNYAPPDVRTSGAARIDKGALLLEGIWLGSARGDKETPACAHRFVR